MYYMSRTVLGPADTISGSHLPALRSLQPFGEPDIDWSHTKIVKLRSWQVLRGNSAWCWESTGEGIWPGQRVRVELGCEGRDGVGYVEWGWPVRMLRIERRHVPGVLVNFAAVTNDLRVSVAYAIKVYYLLILQVVYGLTAALPRLWLCFSFRDSNCRNSPYVRYGILVA